MLKPTLLALLLLPLAARAQDAAAVAATAVPEKTPSTFSAPTDPGLYAYINTSKGDILIALEYRKTPMTVVNFVGLAEGKIKNNAKPMGTPYYDGLSFHRVIPDFMVQGGDPEGSGRGGPGYKFPDEIDASLKHTGPGILSMANAGPGTNGSQFFITHKATPWLNGKHTVFGRVIKGQEVVNAIVKGDTIEKVTILRVGADAEAFVADQATFDELVKGRGSRAEKQAKEAQTAQLQELKARFPNAKTTASGLMYVVTEEGTGASPTKGTQTDVHYTGKLLNGTVFDSSVQRGKPLSFPVGVGRVIKGWDEGIMMMKKGGKRTLIIPPQLGYGERGAGGKIPPNAWLIFDVELVDF